ncbi:hypothetical protein ABB37_04675 [Leptomonas pyrrhocoris]|uniref:Uncharacterized protein n=1 Tax=Leptomonas pyrrhocoris TaxID=157538 RepID=A0A0M9G1S8_LEPPY|nr:hypothetical protein ABB37_04675 [Leptomonas pyrrhocoris]KPA80447.1 hypothetical protein ABB37_04675 [Leptomonas pyrrhocoris]|eukprot:XP_015658886.1 hypothetical protein ABB37_04675 [Leptomonas pyrrhocoris]
MEPSGAAAEKSAEVAVNFVHDDALVPEPKSRIPTTDEHRRAPRNPGSRRITFVDDGKLFEGHFTVQSTNLKSIIQYLLDRHSEQDVIIQDLQKQVHMLRSRSLKSNKRGSVAAGADAALVGGAGASSDLNKRLARVEQFLLLWGVQANDVAELVEEYGDPAITPDAYSSYLLDLPAFRLTRRETRALMLSASQPSAASANTAAASDTAMRRRSSSAKRDAATPPSSATTAAAPSKEEKPKSETPERRSKKTNDSGNLAEATLEKATAALEKAEMLLAELHNAAPRAPPSRPAPKSRRADKAAAAGSGSGVAVDAVARADIDELGDYVMQRFDELETRTSMMIAHSASSSTAHHERNAPRQAAEHAREGESTGKKNARTSPVPPPLPRATTTTAKSNSRGDEVVDAIAREDAAASLDLLEELETTMERRFKDLNSAVANIAARTATLAKNSGGGGDAEKSQSRTGSRGAAGKDSERKGKEQSAAAEENADGGDSWAPLINSRTTSPSSKKAINTPSRKGHQDANDTGPLIPVLPATAPTNFVDQTARDDTYALADRVGELEEELLDRWQAMEERLRIIGRAAMKQGVPNAAGGGVGAASMGRSSAVDRKAREDAALSLMRLQMVEKELAQLKRQLASAAANSSSAEARSAVDGGDNQTSLPLVMAPSAPLRDTYGSKVADLERDVEQRMAEVNFAIAQLRGVGNASPLTLSPQKGDKAKAAVAPVQPSETSPQSSTAATAAPTTPSQLTLRAEDDDALAKVPTERSSASPNEAEGRRRAVLQSMLELGYDIDGDANLFADFPRTSVVGAGGRRTTISRLRSPDVPPFGSHLVQREVVDVPLVDVTQATADDTAAQGEAPTAATQVQAARRVSNVNGGFARVDGQALSTSPPQNSKVEARGTARVSVL